MAKLSVKGIVYTSAFGPRRNNPVDKALFHWGADYGPPVRNQKGVPLFAIFAGRVTKLKDQYGAIGVRVGNRNTEAVEYWHMAGWAPGLGMFVSEGDLVGEMGTTGLSTGIHVHVEHWVNGKRIDPVPFINAQASKPVEKAKGDTDFAPGEEEDDMYTNEDRERDDIVAARAKLVHESVGRIEAHIVNARQALNRIEEVVAVNRWALVDEGQGVRRMIAEVAKAVASIPEAGPATVAAITALSDDDVRRIAESTLDEQHRRLGRTEEPVPESQPTPTPNAG